MARTLLVVLAGFLLLCAPGTAHAERHPTPREKTAIEKAARKAFADQFFRVRVSRIEVSTVERRCHGGPSALSPERTPRPRRSADTRNVLPNPAGLGSRVQRRHARRRNANRCPTGPGPCRPGAPFWNQRGDCRLGDPRRYRSDPAVGGRRRIQGLRGWWVKTGACLHGRKGRTADL